MKNIIIACTLSFLHLFVSGQNLNSIVSEKTKIYIIGVVHYENQFRNTDSLLNILKDIKPDLILSEMDTLSGGYFKSDYTLVEPPKWYKMARKLKAGKEMPPEMDLLYKYREISNSALIYPFDTAIQNRKKYVTTQKNNENKWVTSLNFAYSNNLIPDSILPSHKEFIIYNYELYPDKKSADIFWSILILQDYDESLKYPELFLTDEFEFASIKAKQLLSKYIETDPELILKYL